jgi:hypothetical protein
LSASERKLSEANAEKQNAGADPEAASTARTQLEIANGGVKTAQQNLTTAITSHAAHTGRVADLRKRRDAKDLSAAEFRLQEAESHHAALPIPERNVTQDELDVERNREKATGPTGSVAA